MACKKGQFDDVKLIFQGFKSFKINLNAQHDNGMTHFDVWLLGTLEYRHIEYKNVNGHQHSHPLIARLSLCCLITVM